MNAHRSIAILLLCFLPLILSASDLTGTWRGKMANGADAVFHLNSGDKTVSGTMVGADGKDHPISEGKLEGENISFKVATEWQGMPVTLIVAGKVDGDQMQLHIAADNGYWATDATVKHEAK